MAGTALGLTMSQTYRYVLLPMAFRIIIPPLTSELMNIIKNSSVAFTVEHFRTDAAQCEPGSASRGVEIYSPSTIVYIFCRRSSSTGCASSRSACRCPASSGPSMNRTHDILGQCRFQRYHLEGLHFLGRQLTLSPAMIGGIIFGTAIAMMRLSGKKWLVGRRRLRQSAAVDSAGAGDLLVLLPADRLYSSAPASHRSARFIRRSSPSRCSRRRTTARSCARASSRCRAARSRPATRWASTTGR